MSLLHAGKGAKREETPPAICKDGNKPIFWHMTFPHIFGLAFLHQHLFAACGAFGVRLLAIPSPQWEHVSTIEINIPT